MASGIGEKFEMRQMSHLICPFWSNKCTPSIRLSSVVVWASHFLVEWPVSFLNLFGLICGLPVMLWKQGLKSFSPPWWQVALTPLCKIEEARHVSISALLAAEHKYHNMGRSHVRPEEEISSDKEQLSMKLILLFELTRSDVCSGVFSQVKQQHTW